MLSARRQYIWLILCLPVCVRGEPEVSFNRDVRPILSDRCFGCHGSTVSPRLPKCSGPVIPPKVR